MYVERIHMIAMLNPYTGRSEEKSKYLVFTYHIYNRTEIFRVFTLPRLIYSDTFDDEKWAERTCVVGDDLGAVESSLDGWKEKSNKNNIEERYLM